MFKNKNEVFNSILKVYSNNLNEKNLDYFSKNTKTTFAKGILCLILSNINTKEKLINGDIGYFEFKQFVDELKNTHPAKKYLREISYLPKGTKNYLITGISDIASELYNIQMEVINNGINC